MSESTDLVIRSLGGFCPCQGEGTIAGREWYFRARHEHWVFAVAGDGIDALDVWDGAEAPGSFRREEEWGDGPFAAGYMTPEQAEAIIRLCAAEYAAAK